MPSPEIAKLHAWLAASENDLLQDLVAVLRFPSEKDTPAEGAPFGQANRDALDFVLGRAESWGMRTSNIENMVGYAEFGSGDPLIVSLGHLDVVPTGPGWSSPPYAAEIREGYIYARGSTDDKGPSMASFYAARAIQACFPEMACRFRVIFGCDEESGMTCIQRYVETEEKPTFGIAPDSMWPCVHAEKGIAGLTFRGPLPNGDFRVTRIEGGQRLNIVIDVCEADIEISSDLWPEIELKLSKYWDRNIDWNRDGNILRLKALGKAAHGSTPYMGDSAAARLFRLLATLSPLESQEFFGWLLETTHPSGVRLGLHLNDLDSGDLTSNLGVVRTEDGELSLAFNIRYPVTYFGRQIEAFATVALMERGPENWAVDSFSDSPPLYFPKDHALVETIVSVVEEETGERMKPQVMGGGTYARMIPNTISVGTGWAGDGLAHEIDERLKIEHLYRMSRIYASILFRLGQEALNAR